ncbi:MAG: HD domain-containing protein [Chloroflexi bacterium]|nr:HD domain-containing protein [Chloroflexota bacterium]
MGSLRRVAFFPLRRLRWRIIAPFGLLTILIAMAGAYLVTQVVTQSFQERFNNQLAEAGRVANDSIVRREKKHLETVRSISFTQGIASAASSGDQAVLPRLVQPIAANDQADFVEVLNARGARVYGAQLSDASTLTYTALTDTDDRASWPFVRQVLDGNSDARGDKFSGIVNTAAGPSLYTAGPVFDGDRLAGIVLVGSRLDAFLPIAKSESLADVTVYDLTGAPLASTFVLADGGGSVSPDGGLLAAGGLQRPVREQKQLFGRDFDLLYGNLQLRGQTVALYSVALPSSFIVSAGAATRMQIATLFAVATVAVLLIGWWIGQSIIVPVHRLVAAARAVTLGDLSVRSEVAGEDEIGQLGVAFDAMTARLQKQHLATVRALTSAIDARDPYTMGHSLRVGQLSVEIGTEMGVDGTRLQHLEIGGYLHDIGKIGVRDAVLLKPGALDADERDAIERHPTIGLEIISELGLPDDVVEFVGGHHEKLNGSGYPAHLRAPQLSVVPRIAAVADIYDALTTDRPYRPGMSISKALSILGEECGQGKLDREVIDALERVIPRWHARLRDEPELQGFRIASPPESAVSSERAAA